MKIDYSTAFEPNCIDFGNTKVGTYPFSFTYKGEETKEPVLSVGCGCTNVKWKDGKVEGTLILSKKGVFDKVVNVIWGDDKHTLHLKGKI